MAHYSSKVKTIIFYGNYHIELFHFNLYFLTTDSDTDIDKKSYQANSISVGGGGCSDGGGLVVMVVVMLLLLLLHIVFQHYRTNRVYK